MSHSDHADQQLSESENQALDNDQQSSMAAKLMKLLEYVANNSELTNLPSSFDALTVARAIATNIMPEDQELFTSGYVNGVAPYAVQHPTNTQTHSSHGSYGAARLHVY
jgi:hypothetical protein